ncbi:MAG: glycosyl transferase [Pseudonocardiales bacterium]|nr:MAG: glycosyl transferase [Pseudonocardiales bacterium]
MVIVHYGDQGPTTELANSMVSFDADIRVIANDLTPRPAGLADAISWHIPKRNLGYGDAFNLAIATESRPAYVLLNTDLEMPRVTFDRCLDELKRPGVGIVGPVLRFPDGSLQSGAARLTRWRKGPRPDVDPGPRTVDCTWVTGAAMFVRGEVAHGVGMDGSYFLGGEDADLCVRAALVGWRTVCVGQCSAVHLQSQVISGSRWYYYSARNHVWWARTNFGTATAALNWLHALVILPRVLAADILVRRNLTSTRLSLLGLRHALRPKPDRAQGSLPDEPLAGRVMAW